MAEDIIAVQTTPNAPATGLATRYVDSVDGRGKQIDENGVISNYIGGFDRNVLANGGFDINQRLATALTNIPSPSATARVFTADRFGITVGNVTTPQYQWVDTMGAPEVGITARFYARYKQLTNAAKHCYSQVVPASETATLRGRHVRLQIKARYSVGANRTMRLGLLQLTSAGTADTMPASFIPAFNGAGVDPTFGTNLALIAPVLTESNGTIVGNGVNFTLTNAWQRVSATFLVPTDCENLIPVVFSNDVLAVNDDVLLTEWGLYDGAEIMDWIPMQRAYELLRCQRYFTKTFPQATVPAQNAGVAGALKQILGKAAATALAFQADWRFPVVMFKTPTFVTFNPSAANAAVRQISGTAADLTATATANAADDSVTVTATGAAGGAVGDLAGVHLTADAEI